jgi:predicted DNA-binding protein (MmcQ/YjbR family)
MDKAAVLAKLRDVCLSLPSAVETESHGQHAFKAGRKFFAYLETYKGELSICLNVGPSMQGLFLEDPRFYRTPYIGIYGWVSLRAADGVDWDEVAELTRGSYQLATVKAKNKR